MQFKSGQADSLPGTLGDSAKESDRGELRYRLALRAAIWTDERKLDMTKYEVLKLMQSAYDTRTAVAHGGCLIRKNMKSRASALNCWS